MFRLLVIFCLVSHLQSGQALAQARQMTLVGEGRATAVPDMATVTVGVSVFAKTAEAALRENSTDMAAVLTLLAESGVEPRDMQTSQLSLHPRWKSQSSSNQQPEVAGFQASNTVSVRVRNLDSLGTILDDITQAGANQIQSIGFGLQNPWPLLDEARKRAIRDALAKATLYTEAAGVQFGQILRIEEAGAHAPQPQFARMEAMVSDAVPIARGETEIIARVMVVFELE